MVAKPEALIPAIYDAAVEPEQWPDILRRLSELTGQSAMYLCHVPRSGPANGYTWLYDFDPASLTAYKRDFAGPQYAGVKACIEMPVGVPFDRRTIVDDDVFVSDPGHHALFGSQGLFHVVMTPVFRDQGTMSALICSKERKRGPLSRSSIRVLEYLLPHLNRAIGINQRMARLTNDVALLSGALQNLTLGVLSVASDMRVTFMNREADRILSLGDGMTQIGGRLLVSEPGRQKALTAAVERCARHEIGAESPYIFVRRQSGKADFTLYVCPYQKSQQADLLPRNRSVATIFLNDPTSPDYLPSAEQLAARFGLTATEAEVARLVALGRGMPHVATALHVSLNTARTHLKAIYSKLDVNHQANLTRLLLESFPPVRN